MLKINVCLIIAGGLFITASCKGQKTESTNSSMDVLKLAFNNSVTQKIKSEGMDWATAIMISDVSNHNISNKNFRNAEYYLRSVLKDSSMQAIDFYIQKEVITNAFTSCPDLSSINISDKSGFFEQIKKMRLELSDPRVMPNETAGIASSRFGNKLKKNQIDSLATSFDDYNLFLAESSKLKKLGSQFIKRELEVVTDVKRTNEMRVVSCYFVENQKAIGQIDLSFQQNDCFAKIQSIEYVPESDIHYEHVPPPPPMKMN